MRHFSHLFLAIMCTHDIIHKQEAHSISQRRQRRTDHTTCTEKVGRVVPELCSRAHPQSYKQTDSLQSAPVNWVFKQTYKCLRTQLDQHLNIFFDKKRHSTLLPAGLPIHLTSFFLYLRFGFCWPLRAFINYIYLRTGTYLHSTQLLGQWTNRSIKQ